MSDTAPPLGTPDIDPVRRRAEEVVSLAGLALAGFALGAALWMYLHDGTQAPLVGAIGMLLMKGGTIFDYWLGSSNSSQKKDAVIATQLPPPAPALVLPPTSAAK